MFTLVSVDYTENDTWFNLTPEDQTEFDMKDALHMGGLADLNIYTAALVNEILGWGYFPWDFLDTDGFLYGYPKMDGVVLYYRTLPGGDKAPYNLGATATHEVGHWLGLYHTFHNGCDVNNDFVDDTPAEAEAAPCCPIGRDTCPSPGLDPVENIMNHSDDACRNQFTTGQATRMCQQWDTYRAELPTVKPTSVPTASTKAPTTALPTKVPTKPTASTKAPTKAKSTKAPAAGKDSKATKAPVPGKDSKATKAPIAKAAKANVAVFTR